MLTWYRGILLLLATPYPRAPWVITIDKDNKTSVRCLNFLTTLLRDINSLTRYLYNFCKDIIVHSYQLDLIAINLVSSSHTAKNHFAWLCPQIGNWLSIMKMEQSSYQQSEPNQPVHHTDLAFVHEKCWKPWVACTGVVYRRSIARGSSSVCVSEHHIHHWQASHAADQPWLGWLRELLAV